MTWEILRKENALSQKMHCMKTVYIMHLGSRRRLVVRQDNIRKLYRERIARSTPASPGHDFPSSSSWRVGKLGMPSSDFFPAFQNLAHVTSSIGQPKQLTKNQIQSTRSGTFEGSIEEVFENGPLSYELVATWSARACSRAFNTFSPADRTLITKLHATW